MTTPSTPSAPDYRTLDRAWSESIRHDPFVRKAMKVAKGLMAYHRYRVEGMEHLPRQGAALVVVNHSMATYDSILLGAAIFFETGRYPTGLADRRIFQTPGLAAFFRKLGAVEGSPEAGEWLLRQGHLLMLAPGGMRESLRPRSRRYHVDWAGRLGFARLAIRCQVPVVLAACPAADDIYSVYRNPLTPFIYKRFKWPAPIARGLGLSLLPRPVKLVHALSPPITPPPLREGKGVDEEDVTLFHAELVNGMEALLAKTRRRARGG